MSFDFFSSKSIAIPEGNVTKIMSNNKVLWQKPSDGSEIEEKTVAIPLGAKISSSYPIPVTSGHELTIVEGNYATESIEYAEWKLGTSAAAETYVIYGFDCSNIPTNASIVKVVLTAKTQQTNIANAGDQVIGLLVSSTVKASKSVTTTSVTTSTIENTSLTRSDLDDCRIRVYCRRGLSSTSNTYYGRIYGATLTVTYQV